MVNIAIIGGGASGIMAALIAKNDNNKIDLYEKNSSLGKKLTVSGNGKCNITNVNISKNDYFGNNIDFLEIPLQKFNYKKMENFCNSLGLYLSCSSDGKVYPRSYEAASVLAVFEESLKRKKVNILLSKEIVGVKKKDNKFIVNIKNEKPQIYDKVLVSSGSRAFGKLGATKISEEIAESFGHNVYESYPALVQLETKGKKNSLISGTKIEAKVSIVSKQVKDISVFGDVLFTKYGLSGFAILDISLYVSKLLLKEKEVILSIDMMPEFDKNELYSILLQTCKKNPDYSYEMMLHGLLPMKVVKLFSSELNFSQKKLGELTIKEIKQSVYALKEWRWRVVDTHGFDFAEVCGGGVDTTEIKPDSMESKLVKNLYFSGEALDIVGKRGGFNFAFAWTSGYLAGKSLGKIKK